MAIYVETKIRAPLDQLWEKTQNPALHQRWDARFTSITYLPLHADQQHQRFLYSTRVGLGLAIDGEGVAASSGADDPRRRTSSLRFWSDDPKSLIRSGAGYWLYLQTNDGVGFITGFDYQTRFGAIGRAVDRCIFRPLMAWAAAWSFDRLRLWIERDVDPGESLRRAAIHMLCRWSMAFVWFYQGLVPKLIMQHPDELQMLLDAGVPATHALAALKTIGVAEAVIGAAVLLFVNCRWPLGLTTILMLVATMAVAVNSPAFLGAAFNPVALNLLLAVMSVIGLMAMRDLPSATRCFREKPESN